MPESEADAEEKCKPISEITGSIILCRSFVVCMLHMSALNRLFSVKGEMLRGLSSGYDRIKASSSNVAVHSTESVRTIRDGVGCPDDHLGFHTAPELSVSRLGFWCTFDRAQCVCLRHTDLRPRNELIY